MIDSMKDKLNRFMAGRYGADDLAKFMLGSAVVLMLINIFLGIPILNTLVLVILILVYVRMFSRNIQKRYQENLKYLSMKQRFFAFFKADPKTKAGSGTKSDSKTQEKKNYHIYKCPNCGQKIRIPKGKGKIMITCPKCKHEFQKKS